jgi:hypothetical protein
MKTDPKTIKDATCRNKKKTRKSSEKPTRKFQNLPKTEKKSSTSDASGPAR